MSSFDNKVRIYELAKELRQDIRHLIEEARRIGENVSTPSNTVSKETAKKILIRYFLEEEEKTASGFYTPEKEIPIISKTKNIQPKIIVRLLGYKRKNGELRPGSTKTVENIKAAEEKPLIGLKTEYEANNNKNQSKENFNELFEKITFSDIVSYTEKFLEDLKQSQDSPKINTDVKFKKMITLLKKKIDGETNDVNAKSKIIAHLIQKEKIINSEKNKAEFHENKRLAPIHKVKLLKSLNNDEIEKIFIGNYQNESYEKTWQYIYDCLSELSKKQGNKNQPRQKKDNKYQIPQKEKTYDKLIELLRRKLSYKISGLLMKELRERAYKQLTAQIDSLETKKQRVFSKLNSEKINVSKSKDKLLNETPNKLEQLETYIPIPKEKLNWTILPTGEWSFDYVVKHFRNLTSKGKWFGKKLDETRLIMIESYFKPTHGYIGEKEFEGYVVYCFDQSERKVILECPVYGNATYIIRGDWKEITKSSKWVAKYKHSNQVTVINHSETWFERLRKKLNDTY